MHNATIDALFDELEKIGAAKWRTMAKKLIKEDPEHLRGHYSRSPDWFRRLGIKKDFEAKKIHIPQESEPIFRKGGIADIAKMEPRKRSAAIRHRQIRAQVNPAVMYQLPEEYYR